MGWLNRASLASSAKAFGEVHQLLGDALRDDSKQQPSEQVLELEVARRGGPVTQRLLRLRVCRESHPATQLRGYQRCAMTQIVPALPRSNIEVVARKMCIKQP